MIGMKHEQSDLLSKITRMRAQELIREYARETGKIIWTDHALERSQERDITDMDALKVLREGEVEGEPERGRRVGEWICKVTRRMRCNRHVGVVTVVMTAKGMLKVVTVEWEDLR